MGKGSQTTVGQWIGDDSEKAAFNCRASEDRISTARKVGKSQGTAKSRVRLYPSLVIPSKPDEFSTHPAPRDLHPDHGHQLLHRIGALVQRGLLVCRELALNNLLDSFCA